jgi:hypothetical protein
MDDRYEAFSVADPVFYDALYARSGSLASFSTADRQLAAGWQRYEQADWFAFRPDQPLGAGADLPMQGWKIHAAGCPDNAERILSTIWEYCLENRIPFKFLRSPGVLLARVSKYAPRGSSGKLATIYPATDAACETVLRELGARLDGEPSPYILTDLRWGKGPLYVRYGAFVERYVLDGGTLVPAIADPSGALVPDRRDPVFRPPAWLALPAFLAPQLAARNAVTLADLPYTVERVLHFSNGGGIYAGRDNRSGARVVLKEGRPHAGLDAYGQDAVRRLEREHDMLRRLAGIPGVPAVLDLRWVGEHRFLVLEYVDGVPLGKAIVERYPLAGPDPTPAALAEYTDWAVAVHGRIERIVAAIHRRGVSYGDLHLFNVLVRPDGEVTLLDFEVAAPLAEPTPPGLGNQGFVRRGAAGADPADGGERDAYALACLRLALFLPMTSLLWPHPPKAREFAEIIAAWFPVPAGFLGAALEVICPDQPAAGPRRIEPDPAGWPELRADLARAIVASATPDRDDRLFPGDIAQFEVGGLGLAYGAAGVLYALAATGAGRYPEFEGWLLRRASRPEAGGRLGLLDGLPGIAYALDGLGHRQPALDLLDRCLRPGWESLGTDLAAGLAGVGLAYLHFADRTGEPALRVAAHRAAELVADRLVAAGTHERAGLLHGWSGPALLLLRTYDDTGDRGWLDRAAAALRQELRRCVPRGTGQLEVDEGWRTMPYLAEGSAGIGLVLHEYLARQDDEEFVAASRGVRLAASAPMYIQPGLFAGRAGILLYLAATSPDRGSSPERPVDQEIARQVRGLGWHALPYGGGVAFPGSGLLRLSMDLATGTAGVLLALGAALHDEPVSAPLLAPSAHTAPARQTPAPAGAGK